MSQENVEIVREALEAFNQRDWNAAMKDAAPGAQFDWSRALGPYRGVYPLDQMRRFIEEFADTFEFVRLEAEEFIDAGEHVLVPLTAHFRGRDGVEATAGGSQLWTIRDGTIVGICIYQEDQRDEALEAAGLSE